MIPDDLLRWMGMVAHYRIGWGGWPHGRWVGSVAHCHLKKSFRIPSEFMFEILLELFSISFRIPAEFL